MKGLGGFHFFEKEIMLRQALELSAISSNVMIKIPGTSQGVEILHELTRRGIPTNCTAAYTVPQFVAVAEAVQSGLLEARASGVDLTHWRSVVTYMSTRWENAAVFDEQAKAAIVPQGGTDSAACNFESLRGIQPPRGVGFHADARPDFR